MPTLSPSSVAVIGASISEHKVGHMVLKNLMEEGYEGAVYAVNPKGGEILGKSVLRSVKEIESDVDLAVIVTPAPTVAAVAKECGEKGVEWLVVITAGFSEVHTEEGRKFEQELVDVVKKFNMKLIGPNCLGVLRPNLNMNASFAKELPPVGNVALISQSGAMAVALMDASPDLHLGYSLVLSIGNKAAMNESDFLDLCLGDEETKVIGLYLESIEDGQRFLEVASRVTESKRVVLLKSGVSEHGKKAASSHTGALAGSDAAIQAACAQTGIRRAHAAQEFLGLLQTLSTQPALLSNRIAIITNAGGPGILATDAAEAEGLNLSTLEERTVKALKPKLPPAASTGNPIDVIGDALADRYQAALEACGEDPNIDGICVLLTPQVMTPCEEIAQAIVETSKKYPLMPVTTSFMGGESVGGAVHILAEAGIPNFPTPERAIEALAALQQRKTNHKSPIRQAQGKRITNHESPSTNKANKLFEGQQGLLPEDLTKELLQLYNLPLPQQGLATTAEEAVAIANDIGFPVIAKISSGDILHKTDVGGIKGNLNSPDEVAAAFDAITTSAHAHVPDADIRGVLIQKFLPIGSEFIVGGLHDPSFGAMVMVGLGGIYTELFHDTAFRIAPITEEEGYRMLLELKSWKLLLGLRGKPQSDITGLVETLVAVSHLMDDCQQISELDLNPILVGEKGVTIADAKVVCRSFPGG